MRDRGGDVDGTVCEREEEEGEEIVMIGSIPPIEIVGIPESTKLPAVMPSSRTSWMNATSTPG